MLALLAAVTACVAIALAPSQAGAFNVANFQIQSSSLQASGHPDITINMQRKGSESADIKDIRLDLPTGVFANPSAATACTATQFQADSCPATSHSGSIQVGVKAMGLLDMTVNGSVDVLQADAGQTATVGMTLRPDKICILFVFCAVPNKMFLKTGITVKTYEDSGLRTYTPGSPKASVIGIPLVFVTPTISGDITINSMKIVFQSRTGEATTKRVCGGFLNLVCNNVTTPPSGPYFARQAGNCDADATASVTLVSYQGVQSSATSSYRPNGCNNVAFDPAMQISAVDPTGGRPTQLSFLLKIPEADKAIQDSLPKIVDMDMPNGSGLNLVALDGVTACTEDQLKASACPASSEIGTTYSYSKYIPGANAQTPGLTGKVFAMGVGNQFPIGVELKDARKATTIIFRGTMGTRGDANAGSGRVYATFDKVPQVPYAELGLTITKPVYKNPDTCGPATASGKLTGFNGAVITRSASYTVTNCAAPPDTTVTDGPPTTSSIRTPTFRFTSSIAGSTFQCKIDSDAFAPCSSPYTSEALSAGAHTFYVKALNGANEDPTPASYSFNVSTSGFTVQPQIDVSSTQAVGHPNVTANFAISGGQPKSVALRLPDGLNASLSARPLCPIDNARAGTCPAASKIGTGTVTVSTFGGQTETGVGEGFLSEAPGPDQAGGAAIKVHFSFGEMIAVGGAWLVNNGKNQYIEIADIPQIVGTTQINVQSLSLELQGSVNNLLTNPSNCSAASNWRSTGIDYEGNESEIFTIPFQATGCASVPFRPQINQQLTNPVSGQETGVNASVSLQPGDSAIRSLRVNEPPSIGPNFPAFGAQADQCPASSAPLASSVFNPAACPAQAKVGTMTLTTPLLNRPLEGTVWLINKSPLPWMGVKFDDPGISVRLTGVTSTPQVDASCDPIESDLGYCPTQISVLFNNVPDVPISNIDLTLDGPARSGIGGVQLSGKILTVASPLDPSCVPDTPARAIFTPFSGNPAVTINQPIGISGCQ